MIRRMTGADRTRMSRALFAVKFADIRHLHEREATLTAMLDMTQERLWAVRSEIERATAAFHVKRGSNDQ